MKSADSMHRRVYKNPPILEAMCDFRFEPSQNWNLTVPGHFQSHLGDQYSGKVKEQKAVQAKLISNGNKNDDLDFGSGTAKIQFFEEDETRLVAIGRDALSVHMLHPYQNHANEESSGWMEFEPRIEQALKLYLKIVEPNGINRISLRYVNLITIPSKDSDIGDYLNCVQIQLAGLPKVKDFTSRIVYPYDDETRLAVYFGLFNSTEEYMNFLFDLNVIHQYSNPITELTDAMKVVDNLHNRKNSAFENIITDKARELFNAD